MKPFDLKKALAGEPVITRMGQQVVQVVHLPNARQSYHRVVSVTKTGDVLFNAQNGRLADTVEYSTDLFMAPKEVVKYMNVYKRLAKHEANDAMLYDSAGEALCRANSIGKEKFVAVAVEVKYEE